MAGIVFKLAFLHDAIEYAVGFLRKNERDLSPVTSQATRRVGRLLGGPSSSSSEPEESAGYRGLEVSIFIFLLLFFF